MSNPYDPASDDAAAGHQPPPVAPTYPASPPSYPASPPSYSAPPPAGPWVPPATPYQGSPPPPGMLQPPVVAPPPAYPFQQPPPYQAYPPPPPGYPPFGYGPYAQAPVPAKKKSRVGLIIGIVAAVVVLCLGVGALLVVRFINGVAAPTHLVVELTGQGPAQVTIRIDSSIVDDGAKTLPYTFTEDVRRTAGEVSVQALPFTPGGSVTCRIVVGGTEKARQSGNSFANPAVCITFL
jgi:hypothetical protein